MGQQTKTNTYVEDLEYNVFAISTKMTLGYLGTKKTTGLVEDYTIRFSHVYVMLMFSYVK